MPSPHEIEGECPVGVMSTVSIKVLGVREDEGTLVPLRIAVATPNVTPIEAAPKSPFAIPLHIKRKSSVKL